MLATDVASFEQIRDLTFCGRWPNSDPPDAPPKAPHAKCSYWGYQSVCDSREFVSAVAIILLFIPSTEGLEIVRITGDLSRVHSSAPANSRGTHWTVSMYR
jgi:hypothetical protein